MKLRSGNDFLANLRRAHLAKSAPEARPVSSMTEGELQAEADRLRDQLLRNVLGGRGRQEATTKDL